MNYDLVYQRIIENAVSKERNRNDGNYYENHHIIPRSVGGPDGKDNLVLLTAKEHFVCHILLCEIYPDSKKLKFALWAMCNQISGDVKREYRISGSSYERIKKEFSLANSNLHKGKKMTDSAKSKISDFMRSEKNPMRGRIGEKNPLYKRKRPDDVVNKISKTKFENPEKNAFFKGTYVTPSGSFLTSREAGIANGVDQMTAGKRCKSENLRVISKKSVSLSKDLKDEYIGKTFKDLGWGFIVQPRK
jgi:hypothetical protein